MARIILVASLLLFSSLAANSQNKKVLLEWYACSNELFTADAYRYIDDFRAKYDVIDVSIHAGWSHYDSMFNNDAKAINAKFKSNGYPSGMIDRTDVSQNGIIRYRDDWESDIKKQEGQSPLVAIDVVNKYDISKRELDVNIDVEYLQNISDSTYITVYLVEDSVIGSGTGYDPRNYFNNTQGHPLYQAGDPITGFAHRNVLRKNITGVDGHFLGRNKSKGDTESYSKTITLPKAYDKGQISIVAFVGYYAKTVSGNEVLNVEKAGIPVPNCTLSFSHSISGKKVTFSNQSKGTFDNVKWDFGDGNSSTTNNPSHTYSNGGIYTVKLSLYNGADLCSKTLKDITVPYECQADFSSTSDKLKVTFSNNSTGDFQKVNWDFGNGNSSTNNAPVHTFSTSGSYDVTLTLYDPDNNSCATLKKSITVNDYACSASFSESANNLTASFTNTSTGDIDNVKWDFGDGNTSTSNSPSHSYSKAGNYLITLTTYDPDNVICDEIQKNVSIVGNGVCKASFASVDDGLKVFFANTSTGAFKSVGWDFGDGNSSSSSNPSYTYSSAGNYVVKLTLYDANSNSCDQIQKTVSVAAKGSCTASFSVIKDGLKVSLTNTSAGDFKSVSWDYGDGNTSSQSNPVYTYSTAGSHTITLTLFDDNNNSCDVAKREITLKSYTCQANFDFSVSGQKASFTNKSSGDYQTLIWDFGDGDLSTKEDPEHTYSAYGVYDVCLTTFDIDKDSCGLTFCDEVTIEEPDNVGEHMGLTNINIYPNPSSGWFTIELDKQHSLTYLTVHDNMGKEVLTKRIGGDDLALDLTNLPSGVFFVKLYGQNGAVGTSIVKL